MTLAAALSTLCLSLLVLAHLLLPLLLEVSLLSLGVKTLEFSITLSLTGLLLLEEKFFLALALGGLLDLGNGALTDGANLLADLRAEVGNLDKEIGELEVVREERQKSVVDSVGGKRVLEEEALARSGLLEGKRLVDRLVRDDHVLEVVTSGFDSGNELRSKKGIGDFGALAHDSEPSRELRVILGESKRNVVSLVADSAHDVLVDNTPNETIVSALAILGTNLSGTRNRGNGKVLLAIEGVSQDLNSILGYGNRLDEEASEMLEGVDNGVELLGQSELDIGESRVLSASSVGCELKQGLLLDQLIGVEVLVIDSGDATEADESVLLLENGSVSTDPALGPGAVATSADHVEEEDDTGDEKDDALHLELGDGMTFVDIVPLGVRNLSGSSSSTSSCRILSTDLRSWTRSLGEVGEICLIGRVSAKPSHDDSSPISPLCASQYCAIERGRAVLLTRVWIRGRGGLFASEGVLEERGHFPMDQLGRWEEGRRIRREERRGHERQKKWTVGWVGQVG